MKTKFHLFAFLLVTLLATFLAPQRAEALDAYSGSIDITAGYTVTNGTSAVTSNSALSLKPNQTLGILVLFSAAGTGTSNVVANFQVSPDGTNWTTSPFLTVTTAANGTNAVGGYGLWTADQLRGIKQVRFSGITTTQTNGVTVSGIKYGFWY